MEFDYDSIVYVSVWAINLDKEKFINLEGLSHDKRLSSFLLK